MKNLILIFISLFIFSCNNDHISISKDEYNKLKGINVVKSEYPKIITIYLPDYDMNWKIKIYKASDDHEYTVEYSYGGNRVTHHYIECVKCKKQNNEKNLICRYGWRNC